MMMRTVFMFDTSIPVTDTGPPVWGQVLQARWEQTGTPDTGADLAVYAQQREADTGNGVVVVADDDCLGADFVRKWRSPTHNTAGLPVDTGDDFSEAVVCTGERLRVRVTPAGGTVTGRLYIWSGP
jgi:hypothetical protein